MTRRNWKRFAASSLQEAFEACIEYGREQQQLSVDRIADRMGLPSKWALYKWMESGSMPVRLLRSFEHACGADFVTRYLATSAHLLTVAMPTGRCAAVADIAALQASCTEAVQALIEFTGGKRTQGETLAALTAAMEALATERGNVERHHQPELKL
ncbi:MAG: hypothetical protein HYV17_07910 [Xanthomonadales bacterium]|nr:hypothetical protein [Xanthomonadales bacterium]